MQHRATRPGSARRARRPRRSWTGSLATGRHRFDRVSFLSDGYHRKDVDAFADRLVTYFQDGTALSVDEVRTVAFRPQKGGYRETQVDLLLDTVVDVMLAVR